MDAVKEGIAAAVVVGASEPNSSSASSLPLHPHWPLGVAIPGYAVNTMSTPTILAVFTITFGGVLLPTYHQIRRARPDLPRDELATALWFVLCGCIHFVLEGYFAFNFSSIASHSTILGQMWKEYSLSDSRYLTQDSFVTCMEAITAVFWGPLSFFIAWSIVADHPLRHPLQIVVSLGQLYGDVLYYATATFEVMVRTTHYCRPEAVYFYAYYVGLNAFWIVIPSVLLVRSVRETARVFARVKGG